MTAFERAFALLKEDSGMWDEIYGPLLAETGGMGNLDSARFTTDFVPTQLAIDALREGGNSFVSFPTDKSHLSNQDQFIEQLLHPHDKGDHGWTVERLMENILEHGYDTRGMEQSGRSDPTFEWTPTGLKQFEGRHRLLALDKLGAPYVPYMGYRINSPYGAIDEVPHQHQFNEDFQRNVLDNRDMYSVGGYMDRSFRQEVPLSWMYGRELVPGMGRLAPVDYEGKPLDLLSHINEKPGLNRWMKQPAWDVIHDD